MRGIEGPSNGGTELPRVADGVSEVVMAPPRDGESGIYDATGRLVLAVHGDVKEDVELFQAEDLRRVLRDLAGSPYTIHLVTTPSAIRDWGVFPTAFSGFGTFTWNGAWSPGAGPVGGCFSEWNPQLARPHIGLALFGLTSVRVGLDGSVQVVGWNGWNTRLNGAAGVIIPL